MTKEKFFRQLNQDVYTTPSTADEVAWFYEWMNSPVKQKLPMLAARAEPKEKAARNFSARILEFLDSCADRGRTNFEMEYRDNRIIIFGGHKSLTIKI